MVRLFVYGTLKSGQRANYLLAGGVYLGVARITSGYSLYDLGDHLAMVEDTNSFQQITGELWDVPEAAIPGIDEYEGAPSYFGKAFVEQLNANTYLFAGNVPESAKVVGCWPEEN